MSGKTKLSDKNSSDKVQSWGDKPMNMKVFTTLSILSIAVWFFGNIIVRVYDTDMGWLIATGRNILESGIPRTNPWTIDHDAGVVIQQWLYTIILASAAKLGHIGFSLLMFIQIAIFGFVTRAFFKVRKQPLIVWAVCFVISLTFAMGYTFSVRPELATLTLLMTECLVLDKYIATNKWQYLIFLPVIMLLEVNLHSSMCAFHYAILLAYFVPAFYIGIKDKTELASRWKAPVVFTVIMTAAMFINPYGIDGVLYTVNSFRSNAFSYIEIVETQQTYIISMSGAIIATALIIALGCHKFKSLDSVTMNITAGFSVLSMIMMRNMMFMVIALMFLVRALAKGAGENGVKIDWKKDIKNNVLIVLIGFLSFVSFATVNDAFMVFGNPFGQSSSSAASAANQTPLNLMSYYIQDAEIENPRIFTGFNTGAHFELDGFSNIYIDARPELYTPVFTGGKNIMADYTMYCVGYTLPKKLKKGIIHDNIDEWFNDYDFDYVVVTKAAEIRLNEYMSHRDDYVIPSGYNFSEYVLYEKIRE